MRLDVEATIPFARELVWAAYRDRLPGSVDIPRTFASGHGVSRVCQ